MPISSAQYQFAAEFALFLVAASGFALTLLRPDLVSARPWPRLPLAAGFAGLAAAAFIHGSLLAATRSPAVLGTRGAGIALVAIGSFGWRGRASAQAAWAGIAASAAGLGLAVIEQDGWSAAVRTAGALLIGAGLYIAANRSIVTRVAASSAASVLLIVLVISVGLSAVLDSQVEDSAVRRLDGRARQAASDIASEVPQQRTRDARFLAREIANDRDAVSAVDRGVGSDGIDRALQARSFSAPAAFAAADGRIVALSDGAGSLKAIVELATRSALFSSTVAAGVGATGVVIDSGQAMVVAVEPVSSGSRVVGAAVVLEPLTADYLGRATTDDAAVSLALLAPGGQVSAFGEQPLASVLAEEARKVLETKATSVRVHDGRFIATAPVLDTNGNATLALSASQPTENVDTTRQELFNTLFLIALGGTILALVFAAVVGERIGSGVRRLTTAAQAVQDGDLSVRTNLVSTDEVGLLSGAFDSMAESIEEQTTALQLAATDEARLRNRLEAIVTGMGEALIAVDASGYVTEMNETAEAMFGVLAGAAQGRRIDELATVVSDEGLPLGDMLARPVRERWTSSAQVDFGDGQLPVALSSGPLEGPGDELSGAVLVFRDLRQEREVERMKREFLSRVGHELRTPLAPIMGFSQILHARDVPPEKGKEMLLSIYDASRKLERIVMMLEFFASLEAGRPVIKSEPADLRAIITKALGSRSVTLNGSRKVTTRVARGLPSVHVDAAWVERAVSELVDNAVKFSPKGGAVSIRAELFEEAGRQWVAVTVSDRGIGMDEAQLDGIFNEWVQGDESDTRHFGGLGLGLPLVRRVAENHGGQVRVESRPGKGSKFSILLPPLDPKPVRRASRRRPSNA